MVVTGDDEITTFEPDLGFPENRDYYRVGDRIRPTLKFLQRGIPLESAEVCVIVRKPVFEVSEILTDININIDTFPELYKSEIEGCTAKKINQIQRTNPEKLNALYSIQTDTLRLEYDSRDSTFKYNGNFEADVTGVYQFEFQAKGNTSNSGSPEEAVQRTSELSTSVRFGKIVETIPSRES